MIKCEICLSNIPKNECYTDFYYCKQCHKTYTLKQHSKNNCELCEKSEVLSLFYPKLDEIYDILAQIDLRLKQIEDKIP